MYLLLEGVDVLTGTSIKSAAVENDRVKVITSNDTEVRFITEKKWSPSFLTRSIA